MHASVQKGPSSLLNLLPTFCAIKREPHPYFIFQLFPDGGGAPAPASQRRDLGGEPVTMGGDCDGPSTPSLDW